LLVVVGAVMAGPLVATVVDVVVVDTGLEVGADLAIRVNASEQKG
jgi:hypothetical protein